MQSWEDLLNAHMKMLGAPDTPFSRTSGCFYISSFMLLLLQNGACTWDFLNYWEMAYVLLHYKFLDHDSKGKLNWS